MIRPPRPEDAEAIVELIHACLVHDVGPEQADGPESLRADLAAAWRRSGFHPATDAWVVPGNGELDGYAEVHVRQSGEAVIGGYVRPSRRGRGIGSSLLDAVEERAAGAGFLTAYVSGSNPSARELLVGRGYEPGLRTWQMTIDLEAPPPPPEWPLGVSVRTFEPGDAKGVHALIEAAYQALSPDRTPVPFEEWASYMFRPDTDVSLYFLAELDGDLVGAVLCPWYPEIGWIRQLAVRLDRQGEGLGLALLRHAFGALYARGHRRIGLGVDEWNRDALHLYERAGMRPTLEHRRYVRA